MMRLSNIVPIQLALPNLIAIIIGTIILWIIVSIPVYIAGKALTGGKSTIGDAMIATLFGPVVYIIVFYVVGFFLGGIIGNGAFIWAYLLAFIAWIWAYKAVFKTSWIRGLAIAILATIILFVLNIILGIMFDVFVPSLFFPMI